MGFKDYLNVYEFSCFLPGLKREIKYKPVTTKQLKKLLIYENEIDPFVLENSLNNLISDCVVWPEDLKLEDLYSEDRFFLLLEIRKQSKGSNYQFTFTCPNCKSQNISNIDLNAFEVKTKEVEELDFIEYNENISVKFDFIKVKNLFNSQKKVSTIKKQSEQEKMVNYGIYALADAIQEVKTPDGIEEISFDDKCELIDLATEKFYDKIKDQIEENSFGVDFNTKIKCNFCDFEKMQKITPDKFFF